MRRQPIRIHCIFQNPENTLSDLLTESFRLYLRRILTK